VQILAQRLGSGLSCSVAIFQREAFDLTLNLVQRRNALYRLCADWTQVASGQFVKLSPCMRLIWSSR